MFVYLNYFKNQNYHKYTHLLQIYVDFSCTDLSHGFHHVNVRHDLLRYFCIDFSFYFLTLTVYCIQNCLKRYFWVGRCIDIHCVNRRSKVKHVQSIQFNSLLTNVIQHIGIHIFNIYNYTDHK